MKNKEAEKALDDFSKLITNGDCMVAVYFSKADDSYFLFKNNLMDSGDALVAIEKIIDVFGIDRKILKGMWK